MSIREEMKNTHKYPHHALWLQLSICILQLSFTIIYSSLESYDSTDFIQSNCLVFFGILCKYVGLSTKKSRILSGTLLILPVLHYYYLLDYIPLFLKTFQFVPVYIYFLTSKKRDFIIHFITQAASLFFLRQKFSSCLYEFTFDLGFFDQISKSWSVQQIFIFALISQSENLQPTKIDPQNLEFICKEEAEKQKVFLMSFSHELRNLMNSVLGSIEISLMETLPDKTKDILMNAKLCSKILLQEINNILDSGKVEINEIEIHKVSVSAHSLVNKLWTLGGEILKRKNLRGLVAVSKKLPKKLYIDETRLTQIILNLLGNAIKFTDKGNVEILIEWIEEESTIEEAFKPAPFDEDGEFDKNVGLLHLSKNYYCLGIGSKLNDLSMPLSDPEEGFLKITVLDSGCGMTGDDAKMLFQKFSQVGAKQKKALGTGLGLYISKHVCQKMEGDIKVFSKLGIGTAFTLAIPMKVPIVHLHSGLSMTRMFDVMEEEISKEDLTEVKMNFMICDGDEYNTQVLSKFINVFKGQLMGVTKRGKELVEEYKTLCEKKTQPNFITLDISLPDMDGKEAAREIRKYEKEKGLPYSILIIITGRYNKSEIGECMDPGGEIKAEGFLRKPVNLDEFREQILNLYYLYHP